VKKYRYGEAAKSLNKLGILGILGNTLAHLKETILLEDELSDGTIYLDSFGGKPPTEVDLCHGLQCPISVRNQSCIFVLHVFIRVRRAQ
jgi:hypothetical protein